MTITETYFDYTLFKPRSRQPIQFFKTHRQYIPTMQLKFIPYYMLINNKKHNNADM